MDNPQDRPAFLTAMKRLSNTLIIELNTEHLAAHWDALCDLPIDGVVLACQHLARHWRPSAYERFPVPSTIRDTLRDLREAQRSQKTWPRLTESSDILYDEGKAAVRAILTQLDQVKAPESRQAEGEAVGHLNPPDRRRWLPLVEDDGRPYRERAGSGLRPLIETSEENPYAD